MGQLVGIYLCQYAFLINWERDTHPIQQSTVHYKQTTAMNVLKKNVLQMSGMISVLIEPES